jgi:hypothetical protein
MGRARKLTPPLVVVPSFGRAGRTTTQHVFPSGVVVVPQSQVAAYVSQGDYSKGWAIVGIPDEADGNIARKRNAILDLYPDRDLVVVDDDYKYLGYWENGIDKKCGPDEIDLMLTNGFQMARDVGTPLWGINVQVDRRFYREHAPFAFTSVVLGPFTGIVGELLPKHIRYDEDLWLKEDYDFSLRVLHRFHRTVRLSRYHYMVDHHNAAGGVVGHRDMVEEERQNRVLEHRWGSAVVKVQLHRSVNPIIKVPLRGI